MSMKGIRAKNGSTTSIATLKCQSVIEQCKLYQEEELNRKQKPKKKKEELEDKIVLDRLDLHAFKRALKMRIPRVQVAEQVYQFDKIEDSVLGNPDEERSEGDDYRYDGTLFEFEQDMKEFKMGLEYF